MVVAEDFDIETRRATRRVLDESKPWGIYKKVRKEAMPIEEYVDRVKQISKINLKFAAFCSLLYLTGCRINEILTYKYDGSYQIEKEMKNILVKPPMSAGDIRVEYDENDKVYWLIITSRCEKKKDINEDERQSIIYYDEFYPTKHEEEKEDARNPLKPLINILEAYLDQNFEGKQDQPLFTFRYDYAHAYIKKWLGLTPHAIRGLRAQHLLRYHNFDITSLQAYFNWKDATIAAEYAKSDAKDIKRRLLGRV
jgi:integrase